MAFSSLRPLTSRNFALVWSSALISNVGTWMQTVALGTLITLEAHNALWTALVMAAGFLPMGLLAPIGGVLADRLDRRRWLIVTTVAEAMVAVLLAGLVATNHHSPLLLVALSFLGGSAGALGFPSYQAMMPDLVAREDLLAAVSLSSAQWNMGRVLGPAIAGVVLVLWSPSAAFAINAVSFLAVVIALCFVRLDPRPRAPISDGVAARLMAGFAAARRQAACRSAIIVIGVVAFFGSPFIGLIASVAIDGLHRRTGGPAVLTTAQGIGAVIGALALSPLARLVGQRKVVVVALGAFCAALVLYGASPSLPRAAAAIALVGASYICVRAGLNTVIQMRAPEAERGRILSIYMAVLGVIYPAGLIVEGAVAQWIGIRLVTIISGAALALVLAVMALLRPGVLRSLGPVDPSDHRDVEVAEVAEIDLGGALSAEERS